MTAVADGTEPSRNPVQLNKPRQLPQPISMFASLPSQAVAHTLEAVCTLPSFPPKSTSRTHSRQEHLVGGKVPLLENVSADVGEKVIDREGLGDGTGLG